MSIVPSTYPKAVLANFDLLIVQEVSNEVIKQHRGNRHGKQLEVVRDQMKHTCNGDAANIRAFIIT